LWFRAVVAGDVGAVEHEGHPEAVQCHVHQRLVDRPVQERGIDGHDRMHPAQCEARRRGHCVLFRDADVEDPIAMCEGELLKARMVSSIEPDKTAVISSSDQ
jgi:hypothetical protein